MVFDGWFPFSQNRERLLAVFFVFGQIRTATDTCGLSRLVKAVSVVVDGSFSVSRVCQNCSVALSGGLSCVVNVVRRLSVGGSRLVKAVSVVVGSEFSRLVRAVRRLLASFSSLAKLFGGCC